jgi:hypothetical protein
MDFKESLTLKYIITDIMTSLKSKGKTRVN